MPRSKKWSKTRRYQTPVQITREIAVAGIVRASGEIAQVFDQHLLHYDENQLERSHTQWQFGDWDRLVKMEFDTLQHHPDRAKIALLVAAGHLQRGNSVVARQCLQQAEEWGCSKELVKRILVAGVFNSLGRVQTIVGQLSLARKHFETSIELGCPESDKALFASARFSKQIEQLSAPEINSKPLLTALPNVLSGNSSFQNNRGRRNGSSRFEVVVITGDLLRPSWDGKLSQSINIEWLYSILVTQIACVFSSDGKGEQYVRRLDGDLNLSRAVYAEAGKEFSEISWAEIYFERPDDNLARKLDSLYRVKESELVVAFELPQTVKWHFQRRGIVYVDIRIGQYRFFDDIPLAFSSNDPRIEDILKNHQLKRELIDWYTSCERMRRSRAVLSIQKGSVVFFGQTSRDSSLIRNGCFDSYKNYLDKLAETAMLYENKYYKHHPYEVSKEAEETFLAAGFDILNENTYDLLCSNDISCVMGVTTTVLHEAMLFGKKTIRLGEYDVYKGTIPIYDEFLSSDFWSRILGVSAPNIQFKAPSKSDLIRSTIGAVWGK